MAPILRSVIFNGSPAASLADLTSDEVRSFTDLKIETLPDLMLLEPDDFDNILGNDSSTFIKRKRLAAIVKYLRSGDANTLMAEIIQGSYGTNTTAAATGAGVSSTGQYVPTAPMKLSPCDIPSFSGDIMDQDTYKTKVEAIVGQTTLKHLLSRRPNSADEIERDEELFNGGTAYLLIGSTLKDSEEKPVAPSGHRLWQDFLAWCNSGGRKDALISKLKSDIKALVLDGDHINGFDYVNQWITKHNELSDLGAAVPKNTTMSDFVHQIEDDDFKVTKELLEATMLRVNRGTTTLNLQEFHDNVESRQRTLDKAADNDMKVRSRRSNVQRSRKRGCSPASSVESRSSGGYSNSSNNAFKNTNLKLPNAIFKELSESQQKAVIKWRNDLKMGER